MSEAWTQRDGTPIAVEDMTPGPTWVRKERLDDAEARRDALADALLAALLDRDHYAGWSLGDIAHEIDAKPCMPEWQVMALAALRSAGRLP